MKRAGAGSLGGAGASRTGRGVVVIWDSESDSVTLPADYDRTTLLEMVDKALKEYNESLYVKKFIAIGSENRREETMRGLPDMITYECIRGENLRCQHGEIAGQDPCPRLIEGTSAKYIMKEMLMQSADEDKCQLLIINDSDYMSITKTYMAHGMCMMFALGDDASKEMSRGAHAVWIWRKKDNPDVLESMTMIKGAGPTFRMPMPPLP